MRTMSQGKTKKAVVLEERVVPAIVGTVMRELGRRGLFVGIINEVGYPTVSYGKKPSKDGYRWREFEHSIDFRIDEKGILNIEVDGDCLEGLVVTSEDVGRTDAIAKQVIAQLPDLPERPSFSERESDRIANGPRGSGRLN